MNIYDEDDDLNFPKMYPPSKYDHICHNLDALVPHFADDDHSMHAEMYRSLVEMVNYRASQPAPKFFDCRNLCQELALGHLKSHKGVEYDFVEFASILVPVFSTSFGYGLHLNFFARPKGVPPLAPAHVIFLEVANGDPQRVIRCEPLLHIPYSHGDEDKPSSHIIYHQENEDCLYCEHAKDGSLSNYFCLPPPLM
ncbi:hypothetical protein KSS87_015624 [Heliosperma pusillum]|nr:hypothetical protein KSS87_015624 [Heliosperma pusillum]